MKTYQCHTMRLPAPASHPAVPLSAMPAPRREPVSRGSDESRGGEGERGRGGDAQGRHRPTPESPLLPLSPSPPLSPLSPLPRNGPSSSFGRFPRAVRPVTEAPMRNAPAVDSAGHGHPARWPTAGGVGGARRPAERALGVYRRQPGAGPGGSAARRQHSAALLRRLPPRRQLLRRTAMAARAGGPAAGLRRPGRSTAEGNTYISASEGGLLRVSPRGPPATGRTLLPFPPDVQFDRRPARRRALHRVGGRLRVGHRAGCRGGRIFGTTPPGKARPAGFCTRRPR